MLVQCSDVRPLAATCMIPTVRSAQSQCSRLLTLFCADGDTMLDADLASRVRAQPQLHPQRHQARQLPHGPGQALEPGPQQQHKLALFCLLSYRAARTSCTSRLSKPDAASRMASSTTGVVTVASLELLPAVCGPRVWPSSMAGASSTDASAHVSFSS